MFPCNAAGVFTSAALGVSVAQYLPWISLCFLTPLISLAYGPTGFTITRGPGLGQDRTPELTT